MAIREWRIEDCGAVARLLGQLAQAIGEEWEADEAAVRAHFLEMAKAPAFYSTFVYERDEALAPAGAGPGADSGAEAVAGFLSLVHYRSVFHRAGTTLVNELVVDRAFRGRGIGAKLLERAVAEARRAGMDEIEVGVEASNREAQEFYRRNGLDQEYLLLGREF